MLALSVGLISFALAQVVAGCIGIACAVASGTLSLATLPSLGKQLSNSFALFCVLMLLGYGLVAIPRHVWKRSYPELQLRHQLFRCASSSAAFVQEVVYAPVSDKAVCQHCVLKSKL